jgi:hypothetical protein
MMNALTPILNVTRMFDGTSVITSARGVETLSVLPLELPLVGDFLYLLEGTRESNRHVSLHKSMDSALASIHPALACEWHVFQVPAEDGADAMLMAEDDLWEGDFPRIYGVFFNDDMISVAL